MQSNEMPAPRNVMGNLYRDIWNGSVLGVGVSLLNPFFYAKNMRMIGSPFSIRHCLRGTGINAATSIPQAAVQISMMQIMMRSLFHDKEESCLSTVQNIARASAAGTASGLFTIPVELIVQNIQKLKHKGYDSKKVAREVIRVNGFRGLMYGGGALTGREIVYVASYTVLAEKVNGLFSLIFGQTRVSELLGVGTAGAIGGAVSTPLDYLRAVKQDQALTRKPQSYGELISSAGIRGLMRGTTQRCLAISLACIVMNQGSKIFYD